MDGRSVPVVFDRRLSFVTTAEMVERVAEAASAEMTSSGAWLRGAVLDRLKRGDPRVAGAFSSPADSS
jgi:hypothetical protein